jgi:glycosyltransferase 2 family protein
MNPPKARSRQGLRVALGVGVTLLALWWAFRDVPFRDLRRTLGGADLWLAVLPSIACHWASLWIRALRWQQLGAGVGALPLAPAYRATAIRFMANNLFPLRLGEFVGAFVVSRDVGGSAAAWFGTIVLERALDMAAIMSLALFLIAGYVELGALRFVAFVPILGIAALRLWPGFFATCGHAIAQALLPERLAARAGGLLDQVLAGLAGLRDARGLALAVVYTALLWIVVGALPFLVAQRALGVELGSLRADFLGALTTMVGVGVAVALPQAPGFVGVYHVACVTVLVALGVSRTQALAVGTLAHALFWVSITGFGLLALRGSRTALRDALRSSASPESA